MQRHPEDKEQQKGEMFVFFCFFVFNSSTFEFLTFWLYI